MNNIFANWTQGPDTPIPSDKWVTHSLYEPVKLRYESKNDHKYPPLSLYTHLKNVVDQKPDHLAICTVNQVVDENGRVSYNIIDKVSYGEFWDQSVKTAKSLIKLGIDQVTCVSVYSANSIKVYIAEYGIIFSGAVFHGYTAASSVESIQYSVNVTSSQVMFVQDAEYLDRILSNGSMKFKMLIQMNGKLEERHKNCNNLMDWDTFMNVGLLVDDNEFQNRIKTIAPNKCAVLFFTSGTTGLPKPAMVSHDNLTYAVRKLKIPSKMFQERFILEASFNRPSGQIMPLMSVTNGGTLYITRPQLIIDMFSILRFVKPTFFLHSVYAWKKMHDLYEKEKEFFDPKLTPREHIGLECCHSVYFGTNIAPYYILDYFKNLNIPLMNLYGATEVLGFSSTDEQNSTIKLSDDDIESIKLGNDKELMCSNRSVFMGYLNDEEKNKQSFDYIYWYKTGDLALITNNTVTIMGRLKEQIKIIFGLPLCPVWIEDAIKAELDCISQCMLVGDNELYIIALITLKCKRVNGEPIDELEEDVVKLLKSYDLNITKASDASKIDKNHPFMRWLDEKIKIANKKSEIYATYDTIYAQVKKFAILPRDFSHSNGDLGDFAKMCRSKIVSNFKDIIDDLYDRNSK